MPITYVIECNQCSGLLLASADQKSRTCPFCGIKVNLQRAKRLAIADNSLIASEILRKIKTDRQLNTTKPPTRINPQQAPPPKRLRTTKPRTRTKQSTF